MKLIIPFYFIYALHFGLSIVPSFSILLILYTLSLGVMLGDCFEVRKSVRCYSISILQIYFTVNAFSMISVGCQRKNIGKIMLKMSPLLAFMRLTFLSHQEIRPQNRNFKMQESTLQILATEIWI